MSLAILQHDFGLRLVAPKAEPGAAHGMAVYRNAYRMQLIACLRDTYEKCWAWLGEDLAESVALAHIDACVPTSWTLGAYGDTFVDTLAGHFPGDPEVAELAWLDLALRRVFDGPNATALGPDVLSCIDWDRVVLTFTPTLRIRTVETNAAAIWSALAAGTPPPAGAMLEKPAALMIWRQGFSPTFRTIDAIEHSAITKILHGATFDAVCQALVAELGEAEAMAIASTMLGGWIRDGLPTGFTCQETI